MHPDRPAAWHPIHGTSPSFLEWLAVFFFREIFLVYSLHSFLIDTLISSPHGIQGEVK
jgi:hypothetical protein